MATINPFQGPINYSVDVQSPFEAALGGFKLGAGVSEIQAAQQKRELERTALQEQEAQKLKFKTSIDNYFAKPELERDPRELEPLLAGANKQQFDALTQIANNTDKRRLEADKLFTSQIITALNNQPVVAKTMLQEKIDAEPDPNKKRSLQGFLQMAEIDAKKTANEIEKFGASAFGSEWSKGLAEYRTSMKVEPDTGYTLLPESERVTLKLPAGTYQKGPKGEIKLLAATKEDFKLLTAAEVKAAGLPAGTYQQSPSGEIKPIVKEPLVSVTVGEQGKRDTLALKELDVPRAQEFSASAASARTLARDARVIANLLKGKGGGAAIKLGVDIAKNFGFSTDTVVANDLANALAIRGATQIRPPGSGSTSDTEFRAFVSAFPSLANSEGGRELMAKYADAFAKRSAKIADHARKLIRSDTYSEEEIARFDESLGPVLDKDFYESVNTGPRANVPRYSPSAAPAAAPAAAPRTVDSVLQQYLPKKPK